MKFRLKRLFPLESHCGHAKIFVCLIADRSRLKLNQSLQIHELIVILYQA